MAASYNGSNINLYINGSLVASNTFTWSTSTVTSTVNIARRWDRSSPVSPNFPGYITGVRQVIGTALYTGNSFVLPSQVPAPVGGNVVTTTAAAGSISFNGTNQYVYGGTSSAVLAPGTGDFTIEAWVQPTALSSVIPIFQNDQQGTSSTSDKFAFTFAFLSLIHI